ncbi:type II secretion system protein [bacterium]|nr:type II secretion system protein [bacterium]
MNKNGFTLIELLVAVAIIGTIAIIMLSRFGLAMEAASEARMKSDLTTITRAINMAKSITGLPLAEITNSENSSWNNCSGRDLRNIPETDQCILDIKAAFQKMEQKSGVGITGNYPRDQWKSPYLIDENEDTVQYPCGSDDPWGAPGQKMKDMLVSVGPDGRLNTSDDTWSGELKVLHIDNVRCPNS